MPSTLQHYWHLASVSTEERLSSTKSLIEELKEHQKAANIPAARESIPSAVDYTITEESDQDFAKKVAEAEKFVDKVNSEEVTYAVRRLLKGLASHRDSSRLGFSVALCELVGQLRTIPARHLIVLIEAYSTSSTKVKGQDERDLLFANLFGLYAILQSGILVNKDLSVQQDFKHVIESVWHVGRSKTWLRESSGFIIVEAIDQLVKSAVDWKDELPLWLAKKICDAKEIGPESVAILLKLQRAFPNITEAMPRVPLLASNSILAPSNLATLAKILRDGADLDEGELDSKKVGGSPGQTKAHFVWDIILQEIVEKGQPKLPEKSSFSEAYKVLIDEGLFASTASDQKKYWGFQIFEKALLLVHIDNLASIFTQNFMRTFVNHLTDKDRMLHKAAQHCMALLISVIKTKPDFGTIVIRQLIRPESAPFDAVTGTKTVESILVAMGSEVAVEEYIRYLISTTCQPAREDAHKSRRWALDQLMSVVRNGGLSCSEESIMNILRFFAGYGFFNVKSKAMLNGDASPCFSVSVSLPFTPDVKNICRTRFFSCLGELNDRISLGNAGDGDTRRQQGIMKNGSSWVSEAFDMVNKLEENEVNFSPLHPSSQRDPKAPALKLRRKLIELRQKCKDDNKLRKLQDFETMLLSGLLYSHTMEEDDTNEFITPMLECGLQIVSEEGDKGVTATPLLVPCVVSLLELPSAFLRSTATQCFASFAGDMNEEALEQLLSHLGFNSKDEVEMEEEEEHFDSEMEEEDFISVTSASSISIEQDDTVDPILVAKLQEVLQAAGVADEMNEESETVEKSSEDRDDDQGSDFDDDQMMQIDDKLAEIFKQRLGTRKENEYMKREAVTLHIKIIDLLDIFARRQSRNPLCIRLVLPLFTIVMEKDVTLSQLKQKALTILQKTICKSKEGLVDCIDEGEIIKPMEAIHRMVTTQLAPAVNNLCSSVNVYLTRACKSEQYKTGTIKDLYLSTLNDFIDRSSNNLRPQFLIEAFHKVPLLGFELRNELLDAASGPQESAKKAYRRLQALEMLRAAIISLANAGNEMQDLISFLPNVSKVIIEIVKTQRLRVKEVIKIAIDLTRLTKKMPLNQSQRDEIWSSIDIEECILAVENKPELTNKASIQGLLRQLLAIVKSEDKKNKREGNQEVQVKVKKRKQ